MRLLYTFLFLISLLQTNKVFAQETILVKHEDGNYYEEYLSLKNDTSIKHGSYLRFYKGKVIEKGQFSNNTKIGKWLYFSLDAIFEYEYNYDTQRISKISGKDKVEDYVQTPVYFKGSPIIPYLFLIKNIRYPIEAKKHNIKGRVSLAIQINNLGEIVSFYVREKLHPLLDKAVVDVAKTFPNNWQWIPAQYNGHNIDGEYIINIEFELVE
ncbi:energy transducer TonB [Saccharicrinis aurantiacus]|uniref:energy transducer TonB n=1 Tax=Saccharicrinis aurantiacus TaxID=1849719 RepID=UPI00248FC071|nr:energy transducer TonB [Saccharicrinis aurantiacus]